MEAAPGGIIGGRVERMINLDVSKSYGLTALQSNETKSSQESDASQSAESNAQSGPYITVEDPASGYKYTYIVIGKNFKILISCEPMDDKNKKQKENNAAQGEGVSQQQVAAAKNADFMSSNWYNPQSALLQNKLNQSPKENLLEKIRIWEQCALLNKSEASNLDAKG